MITRGEFADVAAQMAGSVYDFHEKFGVDQLDHNTHEEVINAGVFRLNLSMEELGEVASAMNRSQSEKMFDEFADVLYVALGNILRFGSLGCGAMVDVVTKNDSKNFDNYREDPNSGKLVKS